MGQYYMPYIEWADGQRATVLSHDYDNGLKLTEHSWVGNDFVDAVISLIQNDPAKIGWVGDYSNDTGCPPDLYDYCWRDDEEPHNIRPAVPEPYFMDSDEHFIERGYFINHTKGEYVDMGEYISLSNTCEWGGILNPLPLLTCIGNGQGGGDYRGDCMNMVGYWFMDQIEFVFHVPPIHYTDITYDVLFYERW